MKELLFLIFFVQLGLFIELGSLKDTIDEIYNILLSEKDFKLTQKKLTRRTHKKLDEVLELLHKRGNNNGNK